MRGDWRSYPFVPEICFANIHKTYDLFPRLYEEDVPTPFDEFFERRFGKTDIWGPLRRNFKTPAHFVRACHEKMDGLRLLQYAKFCRCHLPEPPADEDVLADFITRTIPDHLAADLAFDPRTISFAESPLADLDAVRDVLFRYELDVRRRMS
jgi:hypothetical protein